MKMLDVATGDVVTVCKGVSCKNAAALMRRCNVGDVVVVDESSGKKNPLGVLTDRDILYELTALDLDPAEVAVEDFMSRELITVNDDAEFFDVVKLMSRKGIRRVPVVDREGYLSAIFTLDDAIEILAELTDDIAKLARHQRRPGHIEPTADKRSE